MLKLINSYLEIVKYVYKKNCMTINACSNISNINFIFNQWVLHIIKQESIDKLSHLNISMDEMNSEDLKEFLFTVSNPTHELVAPEQYENLVSKESQYQLIPGIRSEMIDNPWEVLLVLLPQSKTTLIDVSLPFISKSALSQKQIKIFVRYLIYKQQLIGIKISSSNMGNLQQAFKTEIEQFSFSKKFDSLEIIVPDKIINFYQTNQIDGYEKTIKITNILTTSNFKIALLFLSQIKDQNSLLPYIKVGCEVISIVNDEQFNYNFFVSNFQNPLMKETILASRFYKLNRIRQVCCRYRIFLVFGGCRICPSINQLYFSKSFLVNYAGGNPPIETDDFQFIPVVKRSEIEESILQLEHNPNLINCCEVLELNQTIHIRKQIMAKDNLFKMQYPSLQKEVQFLNSRIINAKIFQMTPLSPIIRQKIQQFIELSSQKINKRENLFSEVNISGKSMIRCMWVFNMMNLFILSRQRQERFPFTLGVPFTKKTKSLFDTIVFIFDRIKSFQERFVGLKKPYQLNDFVQFYQYEERHDISIEQQLIRKVSGNEMLTIPSISQLIEEYNKQTHGCIKERGIYLCSDDEEQKNKFKFACKSKGVGLYCLDFILIDDFNLPFDIKTQHLDYEGLLSLQKHRNVLDLFNVKLRNLPDKKDKLSNGSTPKQYPEEFIKLKRQLLRIRFYSIRDALKFIIQQRGFVYDQKNKEFFDELIGNLSQKCMSTINCISQISRFFILNSKQQIDDKVATICQEIMKERQKEKALFDKSQSYPETITISSEDQCYETNFTKEENKMSSSNGEKEVAAIERQKTPEQIYYKGLLQCRRLKMMKQKRITQECHRCGVSVNKKWLQKCSSCFQLICWLCIEQIRGVSGPKMLKQLSRYCPVCHKTCECEKCTKKNIKLSTNTLSQELTKYLFEGHKQQSQRQKEDNNIDNTKLFEGFAKEQITKKIDIQQCGKCQLQNRGEKRSIWVECEICGQQECYFCLRSLYRQTKYKVLTLSVFYKNWKCLKCDIKWQRYQHNITFHHSMNQNGTKKVNQLDQLKGQLTQSQIMNKQMGQVNQSINNPDHVIIQESQPIENNHNNLLQESRKIPESRLLRQDEKNINNTNTVKDNNILRDNNTCKDKNTAKHQIVNSITELPIKVLDQFTFNINQPTIHLPPIDPLSNAPIYPPPQKPEPNLPSQQNKIPTLPQPLPAKQSTNSYFPQKGTISKDQSQKLYRQDNIQINQRKKLRRDSSQSNNDNGRISEEAKVDIRKKRSTSKKDNPSKSKKDQSFWKRAKKAGEQSSSSFSISDSGQGSPQISGSSTPNFASMQRKNKRQKHKNKNKKKLKERMKKNIRRRDSSFSSNTSSSNSQSLSSLSSSSSSSSSLGTYSSTHSSGQSKQMTNTKKTQEFTITLQQRKDPKRKTNRNRSRSRDHDANTKKYCLNKRSNSKDSYDEDSTRRTTKRYHQTPYTTNLNHLNINIQATPQNFIISQKKFQDKKRSQSNSKRESISPKRQSVTSKRQQISSKKQQISSKRQQQNKKITPRMTSLNVEFPNEVRQEREEKAVEMKDIEKRQQLKEKKQERTINIRDPRRKFIENTKLDAKTQSDNNQFKPVFVGPTNPNQSPSKLSPPPSNLSTPSSNLSPPQTVLSQSPLSGSPSGIPPTPPSQAIYKAAPINNISPSAKGVSQSRQYIRTAYNPGYKPPIRTLVSQSNTNNSFYANYQKQVQQQQNNSQTNRNLLFKKDKKNDEEDKNIQY